MIAPTGIEGIRPPRDTRAEIEGAAEHFESLLLRHLVQTLRETSLENGFFGKSAGSGTLESMFESFLADAMAEGGPLGLAESFRGLDRNAEDAARKYREPSIEAIGALKWG